MGTFVDKNKGFLNILSSFQSKSGAIQQWIEKK